MSKETLEKRHAEAARRRRWDREEEAAREADAEFERQLGAEEYHRTSRARDFGMPTRATPVVKKKATDRHEYDPPTIGNNCCGQCGQPHDAFVHQKGGAS